MEAPARRCQRDVTTRPDFRDINGIKIWCKEMEVYENCFLYLFPFSFPSVCAVMKLSIDRILQNGEYFERRLQEISLS